MIKEDRIAVDLLSLKEGEAYDLDFELTENEKKYFPNLLSLNDTSFVLEVVSLGKLCSLVVYVDGDITLRDAHDNSERAYHLEDNVEIAIDTDNDENSDILPDDDGLYDLRGSVLAVLFNSIPQNYSEVPLTKIVHENYVLMSEEEYEEEKKKRSNAFSDL